MGIYDANTIVLRAASESKYLEATAGEVISPGMFVKWVDSDTVMLDDGGEVGVSSGSLMTHIAVGNPYSGKSIYSSAGWNYEIGWKVMIRACLPGDLVVAWGKHTPEITAEKGFPLIHMSAGLFTTQDVDVPDESSVFAYNYEAVQLLVATTRYVVEIA